MRSLFPITLFLLLILCFLTSLSSAEEEKAEGERPNEFVSPLLENNNTPVETIPPILPVDMNLVEEEEPNSVELTNSEDSDSNSSSNTNDQQEDDEEQVEVWLPIIEVQFVCDHDTRPPSGGNVTEYMLNLYENLYNELLPNQVTVTRSSLHHLERFSTMSEISSTKWYYSDCNMTSPQLLASLKVKGKGVLNNAPTSMTELGMTQVHESMNEASIQEFFANNVCTNMTEFRASVESPQHHHQQSLYYTSHSATGPPKMTFEHVDHSLLLLCGGEDLVYYEEGPPDGGFLFFGFFVGFLMVSMIATELQKYDQRPHPLGGRRRDYDGVSTNDNNNNNNNNNNNSEVEMV
ncbi:unnamed protein product [Cylindrotheca closterium]|uniref:Subtilisin n=1 Tax=Cylindrotheca closterium TaxID=2856 RepID=A0AAD2FCI9_9STRA|nr:unnamed protein product [Cylindrotheca closterium]